MPFEDSSPLDCFTKEAIVLGKTIADWLELASHAEVESVAMAMSMILESSVNICDELECLFDPGTHS